MIACRGRDYTALPLFWSEVSQQIDPAPGFEGPQRQVILVLQVYFSAQIFAKAGRKM
jgi:hypothetical protein